MVLHFHAHKLGSRVDLPDFLSPERAKGNLCDIKGLKNLCTKTRFLFPLGMITHVERLGQVTPCSRLMKGVIDGVCGEI